jgi:hypothetical protein
VSAAAWNAMLADYARLQIDLMPHAGDMLALGVPDGRPATLPARVSELLRNDDEMLLDQPEGLTTAARDQVLDDLGSYAGSCRRLAEWAVPSSLQHDDLHDDLHHDLRDGNVFAGADGYRFFDWGDATVSHPFLSLLVGPRLAARALEVPAGDPVPVRLRDPGLEPWSAFGSAAELRELCGLALRVSPPARALSRRRILLGIHSADQAERNDAVPSWMAEYLEPGSPAPRPCPSPPAMSQPPGHVSAPRPCLGPPATPAMSRPSATLLP